MPWHLFNWTRELCCNWLKIRLNCGEEIEFVVGPDFTWRNPLLSRARKQAGQNIMSRSCCKQTTNHGCHGSQATAAFHEAVKQLIIHFPLDSLPTLAIIQKCKWVKKKKTDGEIKVTTLYIRPVPFFMLTPAFPEVLLVLSLPSNPVIRTKQTMSRDSRFHWKFFTPDDVAETPLSVHSSSFISYFHFNRLRLRPDRCLQLDTQNSAIVLMCWNGFSSFVWRQSILYNQIWSPRSLWSASVWQSASRSRQRHHTLVHCWTCLDFTVMDHCDFVPAFWWTIKSNPFYLYSNPSFIAVNGDQNHPR